MGGVFFGVGVVELAFVVNAELHGGDGGGEVALLGVLIAEVQLALAWPRRSAISRAIARHCSKYFMARGRSRNLA